MKFVTVIRKAVVLLFWIALWGAAAYYINQPLLLPSPVAVLVRILALLFIPDFWLITGLSLLRITVGIFAAIILGCILAVITASGGFFDDLLSPIKTITKVTPVASFILLVLIWLDRDIVPAIISAVMVLPVVWNNVETGLQNIDKRLLEMARVYKLNHRTKMKRIIGPSIMPYFRSAAQTSIGIGWKAGIAAEVLTVPAHSIGKMIADSKLYMETIDLFAWTLVVIMISLVIEKVLVASMMTGDNNTNQKADGYDRIK